ncbi:MAG: DUF3179 domain-containing (seleno)protein [Ilumatobacter sp.]
MTSDTEPDTIMAIEAASDLPTRSPSSPASTLPTAPAATDGPLNGSSLDAVEHVDTFWFAWSAFLPDSAILDR